MIALGPYQLGLKMWERVKDLGRGWVIGWFEGGKGHMINEYSSEVATTCLHEEDFSDPHVREIVRKLKENWAHSPESGSDIADGILEVVKGQAAELQLEAIAGITVDANTPITNQLFSQLGWITNVTLLANTLSIIAEVFSVGQIDQIGAELRSYLDYSGLSQITGFGYGMILSNAVSPLIEYELNTQTRPTIFDPNEATRMNYRGIMSDVDYMTMMAKRGYSDALITQFKEAYLYYPSAPDFIRFAVREVFDEAAVTAGGLDSGFPSHMGPDIMKAGMSLEVLKWYWRAHWELPSPMMGYEMLHRGELTTDELKRLLQAADYAPGYIDKMIAISYSPYTRVDAKRMLDMGVLDDNGYTQALKDIGYADDKAANMLAWAKTEKTIAEKNLTKTLIIQAYSAGVIGESEAITCLEDIGYDADESGIILDIEKAKEDQKRLDDKIEVIMRKYIKGLMTPASFKAELAGLGVSVEKSILYEEEAHSRLEKAIKLPTKADLIKWVKLGIITQNQFIQEMGLIGYRREHIDRYLMELGQ